MALALAVTMSLQAQDPSDLLQQVRGKVAETLDRLPRYMCTLTISRSVGEADTRRSDSCDHAPDTHLAVADRLRLDVAVTSEGEIFAWAGARKFSDGELIDLVKDGAISNGSFASLLAAIFRSNAATFTPHGPHGHGLMEFAFQVPYEKSEYTYGDREHRMIAGYGGTFLVDTKTGDLTHLVIHSDRLPPDTGECYSTTTLSYARVHLKEDAFLLPTQSHLVILGLDGSKSENLTVFSGCHKFLGEATVKFDAPAEDPAKPEPQTIVIPPGLSFSVVVTQKIQIKTAAVGDIIEGKLVTPIETSEKVLVPEGATVRARLVRFREFFGRRSIVSLAFKLQAVEVSGVWVPLTATPDTGKSFEKKGKGILPSVVALGALGALEERAVTYNFGYDHGPFMIPSPLKSNWVTANP